MDKIIDRLYLGNLKAAQDLNNLKAQGITHILTVASGLQPFYPKDFKYKTINIADTSQSGLLRHFPAAVAFIKEGIMRGGVLVHCYAGVSRSASCVIAYLMKERQMTFQDAFGFASRKRPIIFPNMGFQRQLCEYQNLLNVQKSYMSPQKVSLKTSAQNSAKVGMAIALGNSVSNSRDDLFTNENRKQIPNSQPFMTNINNSVEPTMNKNRILRQVQRHISKGNSVEQQQRMLDKEIMLQSYDNRDQPESAPMTQYQRVAEFDKSAAFGFGAKEDYRLGKMAESNKVQMQRAIGDMRGMRQTKDNFLKRKIEKDETKNDPFNVPKQSKSPMFKATFRVDSGKSRQIKPFDDGTFATTNHIPWKNDFGSPAKLIQDFVNGNNKTSDSQVVYGQDMQQNKIGGTRLKRHIQDKNENNINSARPKTNTTNSRKNIEVIQPKGLKTTKTEGPSYQYGVGQSTILYDDAKISISDKPWGRHDNVSNAPKVTSANVVSFPRQLYVCCGCNTPLFTSKDFVQHTMQSVMPQGNAQFSQTNGFANVDLNTNCQFYFVRMREWMQPLVEQAGAKKSGMLECYRKVCKRKIGSFSLAGGLPCNCGTHVRPHAFQIFKNKVKPLRGNNLSSLSGNIGSSTFSAFGLNSVLGSTTDLQKGAEDFIFETKNNNRLNIIPSPAQIEKLDVKKQQSAGGPNSTANQFYNTAVFQNMNKGKVPFRAHNRGSVNVPYPSKGDPLQASGQQLPSKDIAFLVASQPISESRNGHAGRELQFNSKHLSGEFTSSAKHNMNPQYFQPSTEQALGHQQSILSSKRVQQQFSMIDQHQKAFVNNAHLMHVPSSSQLLQQNAKDYENAANAGHQRRREGGNYQSSSDKVKVPGLMQTPKKLAHSVVGGMSQQQLTTLAANTVSPTHRNNDVRRLQIQVLSRPTEVEKINHNSDKTNQAAVGRPLPHELKKQTRK